MRVLVLYNPIAGAGRAADEAHRLADRLGQAEHDAALAETRLQPGRDWLDGQLADCGLLVVVGGDGAMRLAAGAAVRTDVAVYHYPQGTENLFARQFDHQRSPDALIGAISRFRTERIDVGEANGRQFLLMASMGFDAQVIHDLSERRGRSSSHLSYVRPILDGLRRWRPPRLTVRVDDEVVVDGERGCVVAANSRQYAVRIDPALRASMTDGFLDVVFFPVQSRRALVRWVVASRLRRHVHSRRLVYRLGRTVQVSADEPQLFQIDGDPPDSAGGGDEAAGRTSDLRISLRTRALPVLLP